MTRLLLSTALFAGLGVLVMLPAPAPAKQPLPGPPPAPGKADEELVERVRKGIDGGVRYLKSKQNRATGNWEGEQFVLNFVVNMEGGTTALVTLALLNAGLTEKDESVRKALDYLRTLPPRKTYVVGLQNLALAEARQPKDLPIIQRNADWLVERAIGLRNGDLKGWTYEGGNSLGDGSNTQYALLGLYAAKQAGAKVDDNVWRAIQKHYTGYQIPVTATSGGWSYHNPPLDPAVSFTMTVAGVCGLLIAGLGLEESTQGLDPATGVAANCGVYAETSAVARGMNWIAANFNFDSGKSIFYNVYGIERLGRLSGERFIGRYDWYREGCEYLLKAQEPGTGAFSKPRGIDGAEVLSTSFALLFLSKGRTPVLVSKYAWGEFRHPAGGQFQEVSTGARGEVSWNRKHNDTRHLVEFASKELFKGAPLAWQVYDPRRQNLETDDAVLREVGTLVQSPVLYLNGHGRIPFVGLQGEGLTTNEKVLQRYVEEGGFLFAEACCGDKEFADSFRALMNRIFPNNELRPIPEAHPIWTAYFRDPGMAHFAGLEGLEKGCRTVVAFSPRPMAGYWEEHRFMPSGRPPSPVGSPLHRGEMAYKLAGNVIAYATGLELPKPRLTRTVLVDPNAGDRGPRRGMFQPAQLKTGDAEPAPAALRNLMGHLKEKYQLQVSTKSESLFPGDDAVFKYKFLYLHGRRPVELSDFDAENVKGVLQTGGLLLADASCNGTDAWKRFDASFRSACKKLFPDAPLQVIPADDPIFSAKLNGGQAISQVRCRREKPDGSGPEAELRNYAPFLEGVKVDGRWVVVYSKYDIGCALEGHKSADCLGHDRESAMRLASAVVLYSLRR
ncbi:DUF4159 domain-containing protein [Urbifossiella limnaea]|uniref:DUF4159 domain-containing protein n=1 Tax=Urbifossiella limnaea TaxID=2528023 RepID=A0A517XX31_9BACT|nr:DUF4159 domain-containing protein [Urbifossiella limnaea]QDU22034.1 hypothetical protein ETAA1_40090 [Urbifossiella limnaea]